MIFVGSTIILTILGLIFLAVAIVKRVRKSLAIAEAADVVQEVYPVWAALGPFQSGVESARAMRYAYAAVIGPVETIERFGTDVFDKHAQAFDSGSEWSTLRESCLTQPCKNTSEYLKTARQMMQFNFFNDAKN